MIKKCSKCKRKFSVVDNQNDYPHISVASSICGHCIEDQYDWCRSCNHYFAPEEMIELSESKVCISCFNEYTHNCPNCGEKVINLGMQHDDNRLCYECAKMEEYFNYVNDWAKKAINFFKISFYDYKHSKTTEIMTRLHPKYTQNYSKFNPSKKLDGLIIDMYRISILIIPGPDKRHGKYHDDDYTATSLKKVSSNYFFETNKERFHNQIKLPNGLTINLWNKPIKIGASTLFDRSYGSEYYGEYLVYQGNYYGDTSDFYIIGSINNSTSKQQ